MIESFEFICLYYLVFVVRQSDCYADPNECRTFAQLTSNCRNPCSSHFIFFEAWWVILSCWLENLCSLLPCFKDGEIFFPDGWKIFVHFFVLTYLPISSSSMKSLGEFLLCFFDFVLVFNVICISNFKETEGHGVLHVRFHFRFLCEIVLSKYNKNSLYWLAEGI